MKKRWFIFSIVISMMTGFVYAQNQEQEEDFVFKGEVVIGQIEKVDKADKKVYVKSKSGETLELLIKDDETIIWIDDEEKETGDIKEGTEAEAKYRLSDNNQKIASWIDIISEEALLSEGQEKEEAVKPEEEALKEEEPQEAPQSDKKEVEEKKGEEGQEATSEIKVEEEVVAGKNNEPVENKINE